MPEQLISHISSPCEDAISDILTTSLLVACKAYSKFKAIFEAEGEKAWPDNRDSLTICSLQQGALSLLILASERPNNVFALARELTGKTYFPEAKNEEGRS